MQKNDVLEVEILSAGCEGEGVAKPEGFPLFVPGALSGERCRVQVIKLAKGYAVCKLLAVLRPSPARIVPPCPAYPKCGGCTLQHMERSAQLAWKREKVASALRHIGGQDIEVAEVMTDGKAYGYRNKIQMPVGHLGGRPVAGFFAPRSHRIVPAEGCLLQSEAARDIIKAVLAWMEENGVEPYCEETHTGILRHIYIREGDAGECMVSLITRKAFLPAIESLIERLKALGVSTLLENINPARTNVILGEKTKVLYGNGTIRKRLGTLRFSISHHSFFQVNAPMAEQLYEKGLELLGDIHDKTVFDLYSGIGTISLFLARKAKRVVGIEIVPEAVRDAKKNAAENGIDNAEFFAGDAFTVTKERLESGEKADICVVDPPRKGCSADLLETLLYMKPEKILYISCNPATLSRDIKLLSENGYFPGKVYPFDLFPQTGHVECVVLLCQE